MTNSAAVIVLPARHASNRFPGKPLSMIAGKPLIQWVYERARLVRGIDRVIVATDHEAIAQAVRRVGGEVVLTSGEHRTGTDRVAEVARSLPHGVVVNLQGDEPIFPPVVVEDMVALLRRGDADIVTACHPIEDAGELENANVVKVVMNQRREALYFSRSPIPSAARVPHGRGAGRWYRHVGIYVFRRDSLLRFAAAAPAPLETAEGLEQLRALEIGMKIELVVSAEPTVGVDSPDDIKKVEKALVAFYTPTG